MRKILFRGKSNTGVWVYGSIVYSDNIQPAIYFETGKGKLKYFEWAYVDPETIGQFTGLTDKNGKEIFEGDIIKTYNRNNDEFIDAVVWDESTLQFKIKETKRTLCPDLSLYKYSDCEIIGNIHDNTELLNQ